MIKILSLFLFMLMFGSSSAQEKSPASTGVTHFFYLVPTSIAGNLWMDLDNFWVEVGHGILSSKSMYSVGLGIIVHSIPSNGNLYSDVTQIKSNGFNVSAEHKYLLTKRFYYATQLYFQHTGTIREETYFLNQFNPQANSRYTVSRNETGLIPKVGFLFATKRSLSCDIGLGIGLRYISSYSSGKRNPGGNLEKESFTNKTFDDGSKITQRATLQFRVGYSF